MNERAMREAEIAILKNDNRELGVKILNLVTDVRRLINPTTTSNLHQIKIEEAEVLFKDLKEKIYLSRQNISDIEYKESM